ncbi:hypothetical protein ANTRET_LOCUS4445 [Anthophora retusa]
MLLFPPIIKQLLFNIIHTISIYETLRYRKISDSIQNFTKSKISDIIAFSPQIRNYYLILYNFYITGWKQVPRIVYAPLVARVQEKYAWIEYMMA